MADKKLVDTKVIVLSTIWPAAMLGLLIFFGVFYHATKWMWIATVIIYLFGDAMEAWQLRYDGDTQFGAYIPQVIAAAAMGLLAATQ